MKKNHLIIGLTIIFSFLGIILTFLHLYEGYTLVAQKVAEEALSTQSAYTTFTIMLGVTSYSLFEFIRYHINAYNTS